MHGWVVTSSHIRVPVASKPKYRSLSRFSNTDSPSSCRIRTFGGTTARMVNSTIFWAPAWGRGFRGYTVILPGISSERHVLVGLSSAPRHAITSGVSDPAIILDSLEKWFPPALIGWRAFLQPFT